MAPKISRHLFLPSRALLGARHVSLSRIPGRSDPLHRTPQLIAVDALLSGATLGVTAAYSVAGASTAKRYRRCRSSGVRSWRARRPRSPGRDRSAASVIWRATGTTHHDLTFLGAPPLPERPRVCCGERRQTARPRYVAPKRARHREGRLRQFLMPGNSGGAVDDHSEVLPDSKLSKKTSPETASAPETETLSRETHPQGPSFKSMRSNV